MKGNSEKELIKDGKGEYDFRDLSVIGDMKRYWQGAEATAALP